MADRLKGLRDDENHVLPDRVADQAKPWDRFWLEAAEVQQLMQENGIDEDQLLQNLIAPAASLARPPISSFHVGCVGLGASGRLYVGVNLEFAHLPLNNAVHAEQFMVVNAVHHGEQELRKLAVSAAPCGHCRQFCSELCCADTISISFGGGTYKLAELLPHRFGPADLLEDPAAPLLLQRQDNIVSYTEEAQRKLQQREGSKAFQEACMAALRQARSCYAPYSRCPAGISIVTAGGSVYSGGYLESAAYNPSLAPMQTAIIHAVIDGMPYYTEVADVVLAERRGAQVSHAASTRMILGQIAPQAALTILDLQ